MIVTFPNTPPPNETMKIKHPSVMLLGSTGAWSAKAAKELDRHVGTVFNLPNIVSSEMSKEWRRLLFRWTHHWAGLSNVVCFWVDGGPWAEFEFGYSLSLAAEGWDVPIVGSGVESIADDLLAVMGECGISDTVYRDFNDWVSAIELAARAK